MIKLINILILPKNVFIFCALSVALVNIFLKYIMFNVSLIANNKVE